MTDEQRLTTADIANSDSPAPQASETDVKEESRVDPEEIRPEGKLEGDGTAGPTSDVSSDAGDSAQPSSVENASTPTAAEADISPLLPADESAKFREDWQGVQGNFVDQPREAVEQADRLVADMMQRLAAQFSETRAKLEQQWDGQDDVSTEDLRVAMMRYRSFFERLLSA